MHNPVYKVMVNGLPGSMARLAATAVSMGGNLVLYQYSLAAPDCTGRELNIGDGTITLVQPDMREKFAAERLSATDQYGYIYRPDLALDCTPHHKAALENARFYRDNGLPFIIGLPGKHADELEKIVDGSVCAVISPTLGQCYDRSLDFTNLPGNDYMEVVKLREDLSDFMVSAVDVLLHNMQQDKKGIVACMVHKA